jgi:hypothetical protein
MFNITKYSHNRTGQSSQKGRSTPQFDLSLQALTKELEMRQDANTNTEQSDKKLMGELKENCDQEMKFISLRREFERPELHGGEVNELLPKLKWLIKEHTNYELDYIKTHIEEKKKKLNKIIYENKRLGDVYQELRIKEALTKKNLTEQEEQKSGKKNKVLDDLLRRKD